MKEKEIYTLKELFDSLEITISALARKGNMNEGTASRIRDGYPARRSTLNKLLRVFSEIYGIEFSFSNVSGLRIEDKHPSAEPKKPPALTLTSDTTALPYESPKKRIVKPKKAYTKKKDSGLPDGCISATEFAHMHGIPRGTFNDHMLIGLGKGTVWGQEPDPVLGIKDHVDYSVRNKPNRPNEKEKYLTAEQQAAALQFWKRHDVSFSQCERENCPCHK